MSDISSDSSSYSVNENQSEANVAQAEVKKTEASKRHDLSDISKEIDDFLNQVSGI